MCKNYISECKNHMPSSDILLSLFPSPIPRKTEYVTQYCNNSLVLGEKRSEEMWKSLTNTCDVKINASDQGSAEFSM